MPFWLKPDQLGKQPYSTIKARDDRIQTAPTDREPFKKRRCMVPASGWYEWQKIGATTKKPHHFQPAAKPFAFSGVWDVWNGDGKASITSFSIVTTSPAPSTAQYHDRMLVVLEESQFEDWMRGPPELAAEIMRPYGGAIDFWEVGKDVGNVRYNKPALLDRVALILTACYWQAGAPARLKDPTRYDCDRSRSSKLASFAVVSDCSALPASFRQLTAAASVASRSALRELGQMIAPNRVSVAVGCSFHGDG